MSLFERHVSISWIIILILLLIFTPVRWIFPSSYEPSRPTEIAEVVKENGFNLRLNGVTVSGSGDTAPLDTPIEARLIKPVIPESVSDFAEPIGTGVEISLGNNLQPTTPLTITFSAREVAGWYEATEDDADLMPVVFASNDSELGVEFADAELMADGSVVVTTHHLSEFYPGVTSAKRFSDRLFEEVAVAIGTRSEQPSCVSVGNEDWVFSPISDQALWPCVSESASGLDVSLTNNSPHVWMITSNDLTAQYPGVLAFPGTVIAAVGLQMIDRRSTSPLIPPDGDVTFITANPPDVMTFNAELNPPLTVINAVVASTAGFLPSAKVQAFLTQTGTAECLIGFIQEAFSTEIEVDGGYVNTLIGCVGTLVRGLPGTLISSITAVPGAAVTFMDGAGRSISGNDSFSFTLSRRSAVDSSGISAWPTHRDDGGTLYIWLGANMYDYPDWIACDDARDWCLIGYNGAEHLLVQMDGLVPMYWMDDTIDDPRAALLSVGLSEDVVNEILGD